jgi:hypothetical protein
MFNMAKVAGGFAKVICYKGYIPFPEITKQKILN